AQVDVAVLEARLLVDALLVDLERQRLGGVQHLDHLRQHLDLAGGDVWILGAGRRRRTWPVIFSTYSLRTFSATAKLSRPSGSNTTCTRPARSRKSMKTMPP